MNTFAIKNYGKFANRDVEKLCPWSLALILTIPVFALEKIYPPKVGPWPQIFFSWPQILALAFNVSSTPPLVLNWKLCSLIQLSQRIESAMLTAVYSTHLSNFILGLKYILSFELILDFFVLNLIYY